MELPARIGRYDIELLLGDGGLGRVLLARDTVLGRQVAIKILRDDVPQAPETRSRLAERIRHEARAAASLSHPAIVTLHDMGEDERVGLYLVFEFVTGITLRERLQRGRLPPLEVAQLARTLGSALTHAHSAGVVHRAVTPENVMLGPLGAKLADFGIARLSDPTATTGATTQGRPGYTAPEALATGSFSAQSDQFSLAVTLYEALTSVRPFSGDDAFGVALKVAAAVPAPPTSVVPSLHGFVHLDAIFDRALAKDAGKRFPSCEGFASVLATELETPRASYLMTPLSSPVISRSSIVPRATRRWQNAVALAAVGVIVALVGMGRLRQYVYGASGSEAGTTEGVSLRSVASAFGAVALQRVGPPLGARHPRLSPGPPPAPARATGSASTASAFANPLPPLGSAAAPPHDP
ncbi:MAG: serine/threonine protein kinase [Myxococcota bacterium]|nr:serine/threonine protein kinase [Myxococcota bacterium]